MSSPSVERSITISAPPDRVYQALTDPAQIHAWFMPSLSFAQLERDDSGTLIVNMGPMSAEIARLESLNPPHQATLRSLPDQVLAATYNLAPHTDGTRLTVTMTGFDALPADSRQDRVDLSVAGWDQALANLKASLDGTSLPHPQAFVGPLFAYWREPHEQIAVERTIFIRASRDRVWRAITDPAELAAWFSPGTEWGATGLEVGARIFIKDPTTGAESHAQTIELIDPPHQLVTRSIPETGEVASTTIWRLIEEQGGTRLILTYTGYELMTPDSRRARMEENTFGFGMMLQNLRAHLEGESLPFPLGF